MVVYLDYNATTPVDVEVQKTIMSTLKEAWGNPSCSYDIGKDAKSVIRDARRKVAEMIGCASYEIVFTSGGTESNHMAIHTAIKHFYSCQLNIDRPAGLPHIITSTIEHDSVKLPLQMLTEQGKIEVTYIPVSKTSHVVECDDIINAVRPTTCLISLMLANNETGVIQPAVPLLRSRLKKKGHKHVLLHTDAAQAIGKIEVDVENLDVDYLTIVGHKFYGPRIGALYFKFGSPLYSIFYGGGQEQGYRSGTENTCMIAGLGKAAELVNLNIANYNAHMLNVRDQLEKALVHIFPYIVLHIPPQVPRLPNTVSFAISVEYITGKDILNEAKDIRASTGAACHTSGKPSSILIASGISESLATKTIRFSIGRETTVQDIDIAIRSLSKALEKLC